MLVHHHGVLPLQQTVVIFGIKIPYKVIVVVLHKKFNLLIDIKTLIFDEICGKMIFVFISLLFSVSCTPIVLRDLIIKCFNTYVC